MRCGFATWTVLVLLVSCANKGADKVTREDCAKVADHISTIIMQHYTTNHGELWDGIADKQKAGIPPTVTRETFKAFIDSPEGRTWQLTRLGQVRSSAESRIKPCVESASPKLIKCLLAAKTRDDIGACDKAYPGAPATPEPTAPEPTTPEPK